MASVSWDGKHSRAKTTGQARQMLEHVDPREQSRARIKQIKERKGELTFIRPENSKYNIDLYVDPETREVTAELMGDKTPGSPVYSSYEITRDRHRKKLEELDSQPKANKRKNRVINQMIEFPTPEWLQFDPDGTEEEKQEQAEALKQFYVGLIRAEIEAGIIDPESIVSISIHLDEVHMYRDAETGEPRQSRPHMHVMLFPLYKGRLCWRDFSTNTRIIQSNQAADKFCLEEYGKTYRDGTKKKSKKTVQKLKQESTEREADAMEKEAAAVQAVLDDLKEQETRQREELQRQRIRVTELQKEGDAREELQQILEDLRQYRDERREAGDSLKQLREYIEAKARPATVPYILQILENFEKDEKSREAYEGRTARRVDYLSEQLQKKEQKKMAETPQKPAEASRRAPERARVEQKQETPRRTERATEKPRETEEPKVVERFAVPLNEYHYNYNGGEYTP